MAEAEQWTRWADFLTHERHYRTKWSAASEDHLSNARKSKWYLEKLKKKHTHKQGLQTRTRPHTCIALCSEKSWRVILALYDIAPPDDNITMSAPCIALHKEKSSRVVLAWQGIGFYGPKTNGSSRIHQAK